MFYFIRYEKRPGPSEKSILWPKIILTFHFLNKLILQIIGHQPLISKVLTYFEKSHSQCFIKSNIVKKKKESWDSINGCEHFRGISKWLEVYYSWWSCLQKVMLGSFYRLFSSRSGNKVRSQSDIKPAGLFLQCATEQRSLLCLGIQITAFLQKQHVLDRQCQDQNPTIAHCFLGLLKDNPWFCSWGY